ncbi:hypothetical protein LRP50_16015 [Enterovibrio sp. ZSDZ42]|uniref:Uncharacterized protein n=1 Tax=Enterovibrio gelatinilyticus TaxID=2899819 RepID=A0ABT5R380_9GAMM|nr:hypothetical protein [Enterovibrio sp. ZSDZ42]MDD1794640.1 hypothetical protein [Enterovibrio sp. ZSDZ42]
MTGKYAFSIESVYVDHSDLSPLIGGNNVPKVISAYKQSGIETAWQPCFPSNKKPAQSAG